MENLNEMKPEDVIPEGAVIDALVIRAPHDAVCRHALEIIRAYRKENGAMQEMVDTSIEANNHLSSVIEEKDAEIERLSHQCSECAGCTQWKCDCSNIRADAITEFAKRLKEHFSCHDGEWYGAVCFDEIDQIAKEMKEGNGGG